MDTVLQLELVVNDFCRVARGTRLDQLDNPTPCELWKVRDIFYHLSVGSMYESLLQGEEPSPEDVEAYTRQVDPERERPAIPDEELVASVADRLPGFVDVYSTPGVLERTITLHLGEMTGETFARLSSFDILVHTWDLATSTGQSVQVSDEVVLEILEWGRGVFADGWRKEYTFAAEAEPRVGASAIERLAAFSGRKT
jgi:uncharacterized protein (TIGR03086 family)